MGIRGLPAYLRRHAPDAFVPLRSAAAVIATIQAAHAKRVANFPGTARGPAVAVDVPSLFYRVMYCAPDAAAGMMSFLALFQPLRAAGVTVVFLFDNPRKPNKGPERERRRARANADRKRLAELQGALAATKAAPQPHQDVGEWMDAIEAAQDSHDRVAKRLDVVGPRDYTTLNHAMIALGYTTWVARDEGEAAAAHLYKAGAVDAVVSDDFDVLPLGVGLFIRNLGNYSDSHARHCQAVHLPAVLRAVNLTHDAFLEMCVLCGSDFTEHLKGMGPVKARKTLAVHKGLERYFASGEYAAAYPGAPPFEWRVALAQFRDTTPPALTVGALVRLYGALLHRAHGPPRAPGTAKP